MDSLIDREFPPPPHDRPPNQRAHGAASVAFKSDPATGETRLADLYQSHPMRVLFPRPGRGDPLTAVVTTVSGGIAGGDKIDLSLETRDGASAFCLAQAAEKIYRAAGDETAKMQLTLKAASNSTLEYLPQETILFDRARLARQTVVDLADDTARVLAGEIAVFGRGAMGEHQIDAEFEERWRVQIAGRPVWSDAFRLSPEILESPFGLDGARAIGTALCISENPKMLRDMVRDEVDTLAPGRIGATVIGPMLLVRFMDRDPAALRKAFMAIWTKLRAAALDRPARLPPLIHC